MYIVSNVSFFYWLLVLLLLLLLPFFFFFLVFERINKKKATAYNIFFMYKSVCLPLACFFLLSCNTIWAKLNKRICKRNNNAEEGIRWKEKTAYRSVVVISNNEKERTKMKQGKNNWSPVVGEMEKSVRYSMCLSHTQCKTNVRVCVIFSSSFSFLCNVS